jgi:hypothetical protein
VTSVPANAVALFNYSPSSDPSAFAKQSDSNPNNTEVKELVHGLDVVRKRALSLITYRLSGSAFRVPRSAFRVPRSVPVLCKTITWQGLSSLSPGLCSAKGLAGITRCGGRWRCAHATNTTQSERCLLYAGLIAVVAPSLLQRRRTRIINTQNKTKLRRSRKEGMLTEGGVDPG